MTPKALLAPARLAGRRAPRRPTSGSWTWSGGERARFRGDRGPLPPPAPALLRAVPPAERAEDVVQQAFVNATRRCAASGRAPAAPLALPHRPQHGAERPAGPHVAPRRAGGADRRRRAPRPGLRAPPGPGEVMAAVEALPERQRDAIVLRELEGRSYDEIATALGVTDGAVRQLFNRARTTLRAGVTAVTPVGLLRGCRGAPEEPIAARMAEPCGTRAAAGRDGGEGCATALVTGAVVGGVAGVPAAAATSRRGPDERGKPRRAPEAVRPASDDRARGAGEGGGGSAAAARGDGGVRSGAGADDSGAEGSRRRVVRAGATRRQAAASGGEAGPDSGPAAQLGSGSAAGAARGTVAARALAAAGSGRGSGGSGSGEGALRAAAAAARRRSGSSYSGARARAARVARAVAAVAGAGAPQVSRHRRWTSARRRRPLGRVATMRSIGTRARSASSGSTLTWGSSRAACRAASAA